MLTRRWKMSAAFITDRLGVLTSGFWWVLADRGGKKWRSRAQPKAQGPADPWFHQWDLTQPQRSGRSQVHMGPLPAGGWSCPRPLHLLQDSLPDTQLSLSDHGLPLDRSRRGRDGSGESSGLGAALCQLEFPPSLAPEVLACGLGDCISDGHCRAQPSSSSRTAASPWRDTGWALLLTMDVWGLGSLEEVVLALEL